MSRSTISPSAWTPPGSMEANNTFQLSDNFSKVMGTHIFKAGAGFHLDQVNINPDATFNGAFSFTGAETGSDFADFLLGIPSSYAQGDSLAFYFATGTRDSTHRTVGGCGRI